MKDTIKQDVQAILNVKRDWKIFEDAVFLISGANSFMMTYLIYTLLENNKVNGCHTRIVALCRNLENAEKRFGEYMEDPNLSLIIQDVCQPIIYEDRIDYCIHAASPAGIQSRQEHPLDTFLTNVSGCKNLLNLCREKQIKRFMLLSSVDVYGTCQSHERLRESDVGILDWNYKRNAYSNGKRTAETLCSLYCEQYGMPCVIARPFQIYGPGMSLTDGRLHGDFIRQILENNKIVLKSDGSARRSFMYLTDATLAMLDVLLYGHAGEAYNICDEDGERSVRELAELYAATAGDGVTVEFAYDERETPEVKEAISVVLGNSEKLRELGWRGQTALSEGVERTLQFYKHG